MAEERVSGRMVHIKILMLKGTSGIIPDFPLQNAPWRKLRSKEVKWFIQSIPTLLFTEMLEA